MENAPVSFERKHPIILPSKHHVTNLVIQNFHRQHGHCLSFSSSGLLQTEILDCARSLGSAQGFVELHEFSQAKCSSW